MEESKDALRSKLVWTTHFSKDTAKGPGAYTSCPRRPSALADNVNHEAGGLSAVIPAILFSDDGPDVQDAAKGRWSTDDHFNTLDEALKETNHDKLVARLQADIVECSIADIKALRVMIGQLVSRSRALLLAQRSFTVGPRKFMRQSTHPGERSPIILHGRHCSTRIHQYHLGPVSRWSLEESHLDDYLEVVGL